MNGKDLRFAFRQFLQKPGFTTTAVLVLALGIGANVAVFSLVTAFNFTPLPVRDPDQFVAVTLPESGKVFSESRYAAFAHAASWAGVDGSGDAGRRCGRTRLSDN